MMALALGDVAAADSLIRHTLRMERALGMDDRKSGDIGLALVVLARVHLAQGDSARARATLEQAMVPLLHGLGPAHYRTREARNLADSLRTRERVASRR